MANTSSGRGGRQGGLNKEKVAQQFVKLYYTVLNDKADYLHQFYGASSTVVVSEVQDGGQHLTVDASTEAEIGNLLHTLFKDVTVTVDTSFPQESIDGSVLLLVSGRMTRKGIDEERFFTQAFLLARQPSGFYIRTDTLQVHSRGSCRGGATNATRGSSGGSRTAHTPGEESAHEPQPEYKPMLNGHGGPVVQPRDVSGLGLGTVTNASGMGSDVAADGAAPGAVQSLSHPHVLDGLNLDGEQGGRDLPGVGELAPSMVAAVGDTPAANGIARGGVAAENGVKDLEVEPPSQIVAPIEKPIDMAAEAPPLDPPVPRSGALASTAAALPPAVGAAAPPASVVALAGPEAAADPPVTAELAPAAAATGQKMSYAQILKSEVCAAAAAIQAQSASQTAPSQASDPVSGSQPASETQPQGWNPRPRDKRRPRVHTQADGGHGF